MKKVHPDYHIICIALIGCLSICSCSPIFAKSIDPTRPPKTILDSMEKDVSAATAPNRLTAIFQFTDYSLAVIDSSIVKEGDHMGEYVVTTIKKNEVELTGLQNKRIMLKLSPSVKEMRELRKGSSQ